MAQSWVLKVNIHCEGCKKKVKKVLQKVQGVYTVDIDSNQSRVTVTGDVDGESLVRKLLKYGKHSELLTEKNQPTANSSSSAAAAATEASGDAAEAKVEGKAVEITAPLNGGEVEPSKLERSSSEKPSATVVENEKRENESRGDEGAAVYDSGRVLPGNSFIVENQPVYTMSYSAVHPSTSYAYYQAPPAEMPSSYGYTAYPATAIDTPEYYSRDYYSSQGYYGSMEPQAPPEGSYDMFSEENPNACNLM
ncbi:hypothetical protein KSP39_PZI006870 [Platanthera zijinensis]|uniref:HMA domain-containing protein n=1 Tax=Platanthera zijinensis TaxID=2320716 RepID=A0AAP0BPW3_9ASPA